jgi:hypothetical protein
LQATRENLIAAIGQFGPRPIFAEKIAELDQREKHVAWERQRLESVRAETIELPDSVADLRALSKSNFESWHSVHPSLAI